MQEDDHDSDPGEQEIRLLLVADGPAVSIGKGNAAYIAIAVGDVKKSSPIRDAESRKTLECV
jgi:hypothetical protein